ncbi:MAG TPA: hypothetical protein VFH38_01230 [Jatrophihabitans sp.]|nr:hypothetical protein [Jatrophihabitans sp.]
MTRRAPDYVQPSWTGSGLIELRRGGERFWVRDFVLVPIGLLILDSAFWGIGAFLLTGDRVVCGTHCYADPQAVLHDVHMFWLVTAIPVAASVVASCLLRAARVATTAVQLAVVITILVVTLPAVHRADAQQAQLDRCHYGATGHCAGVRRLT